MVVFDGRSTVGVVEYWGWRTVMGVGPVVLEGGRSSLRRRSFSVVAKSSGHNLKTNVPLVVLLFLVRGEG